MSGPLLDRIDMHVEVAAVTHAEIASQDHGGPSEAIRSRVIAARDRQRRRNPGVVDALLPAPALRLCPLDDSCRRLPERAVTRLGLSARAHDRVLRVARTIADMEGEEAISAPPDAEAIQYAAMDRAQGSPERGS